MDSVESFSRLHGFPVKLVFGVDPCDSLISKLGWKSQRTYHLPGGKMRWLHVCYIDEDNRRFEQWRFACQEAYKDQFTSNQPEASWLVRLVKAIERQEITQCRQSAIDPPDILAMLKGEYPRFDRAVAYEIPDFAEAMLLLCDVRKKELAGNDVQGEELQSEFDEETVLEINKLWKISQSIPSIKSGLGLPVSLKSIMLTPTIIAWFREQVARHARRDAIASTLHVSGSSVSKVAKCLGVKFEGTKDNSKNFGKKPLERRKATIGKNTATNGRRT